MAPQFFGLQAQPWDMKRRFGTTTPDTLRFNPESHSPADVRNTLDEHTALLHQIISIKEKQQASRPNSPGSRVRSLCDAEGIESLFSFRYSPSPPADEPTTIPYAVNTQGHTHASAYYDGSESAVTEGFITLDGQNPYADNLPSGYTTSEDHGVEQRFVTVTKHNEIVVQWERAYQELQSRIGRLETELGRARGYANGWVSAYKRLRAENANNVSRLEKIDKDNKALGQSNNDLHNRLGDNKQVIKSLQNEIIELEQGRNSLKEENRILSSRNYELRIESVQTTNTYERELTLLGGSCNEWWRESDILWRKYRRSQRIRAQHENQLERMDQQLGDLLCRNEELRQRPTVVQSVINLNLQHVKQVQAGLHEHDAKLDQMLSNVQYLASNEHLMKKLRSNAEGLLKQHGVQLNSALSQPSRHQQRRSTVPLDDGSKTQHSYQDDVSRSREEPGLEFSKSITSKPPTNTKLRASSQAREPTSTAAGRLPVVRPVQLDNHINGADLGESTMLRGSHHGDATLQPSIQQATQQQRRARPQSSRHKRHRAESDLPHRDAHLETEPRSCLWWFAGQRKPRRS
ncbi:MAG: hypothetical protein M1827_002139 [Pycnora praestabilis]|nr:MAG: hypothetical protein M1827_002139 [Pycnora praestabilis]